MAEGNYTTYLDAILDYPKGATLKIYEPDEYGELKEVHTKSFTNIVYCASYLRKLKTSKEYAKYTLYDDYVVEFDNDTISRKSLNDLISGVYHNIRLGCPAEYESKLNDSYLEILFREVDMFEYKKKNKWNKIYKQITRA